MSKPLLSVLVPGIRPNNWLKLYTSIQSSYVADDFEMICVGPQNATLLQGIKNYKYIQDWGSPSRAQQIALCNSSGKYITWAADDGWFLPFCLREAILELQKTGNDYDNVITCKYLEGSGENMLEEWYYKIITAEAQRTIHIPASYYILNVGIINREYLISMGGWDAENFETAIIAYHDLAVRLQRNGGEFILLRDPIYQCTHMPGRTGDHGPIHDAQLERDEPRFRDIYSNSLCINRKNIDINNWMRASAVWGQRFN